MHLMQELYPRANSINIPYIADRDIIRKKINGGSVNIMVSHSGWPHNRHHMSFELLTSFASENIKIICPLCYGEKKYIEDVVKEGKSVFGEKFNYFTELKSAEEYDELLHSIDIYVSAASIQTGLYALMTTIVSGAKVYITGNLYDSMREYGFIVNNFNALLDLSYERFSTELDDKSYEQNVNIYSSRYINIGELQEKWKYLYSR